MSRLLAVASELRAVATEVDESEGETRAALAHWAHEIEHAVDELRETASAVPPESSSGDLVAAWIDKGQPTLGLLLLSKSSRLEGRPPDQCNGLHAAAVTRT